MSFIKATDMEGLAEGTTKRAEVGGVDILFANVDGEVYAISNVCTHMGGLLHQNPMENGILTCPKHGAQFDVRTGRSVRGAKVLFSKIKVKDEKVYPVKVEGNDILVDPDV